MECIGTQAQANKPEGDCNIRALSTCHAATGIVVSWVDHALQSTVSMDLRLRAITPLLVSTRFVDYCFPDLIDGDRRFTRANSLNRPRFDGIEYMKHLPIKPTH